MKFIFFFVIVFLLNCGGKACKSNISSGKSSSHEENKTVILDRNTSVNRVELKSSWGSSDSKVVSYFTECMVAHSPQLTYEVASMYVNFVISHDIWYTATKSICRYNQDVAKCWHENAKRLLNLHSTLLQPFQTCLKLYFADDKSEDVFFNMPTYVSSCKANLIRPFFKARESVDCDKRFDFATCMNAEQEKKQFYCDFSGIRRKYDFHILKKFFKTDRCDCTYKKYQYYYEVDCDERNLNFGNDQYKWMEIIENVDLNNYLYLKKFLTPKPQPSSCFAKNLLEKLRPNSHLHDTFRLCVYRQHNRDQEYKSVVGHCPENTGWTQWFDEGKPANNRGDEAETIKNYKYKYRHRYTRLNICRHPLAVEVKTYSGDPFTTTGDFLSISPSSGVECKRSGSTSCQNYKVRFCCKYTRPQGDSE